MVNTSLVRAASRLSPKMIAYHLKRAFRNRFCRSFPALYERHVARIAALVPALVEGPTSAARMAEGIAAFYHDEYRDGIDAAARGTFDIFGQTVAFGGPAEIDWHHTVAVEDDFHLWRMKLAHMGFLCPMLIDGDEMHLKAVSDIIAAHRARIRFDQPGAFSSYLFPYSVSHRILALTSGYLIARSRRSLPVDLCRRIEDFLRWNVGFVLANVEHELKNNHVERNLAALCFYYSGVAEVSAALARRLDRDVARIIEDCILEDGLLAERSAMYQGLAVMALGIFVETEFLSPTTRALAAKRLEKAKRAWALMTHPDGEIALFNDSWFGEVPEAASVMSMPAFGPIELLPTAGYARLEAGDIFVLFDAGQIGPRWNPGHGHADFLSMEVDVWGRRFLVDPGTYQYSTGPRRQYDRSAHSHNGPFLVDREPVEYHGCFRVGKMSEARLISSESGNGHSSVTGELRISRTVLRRHVEVSAQMLRCIDEWLGDVSGAMIRLLIPADWDIVQWDQKEIIFTSDEGRIFLRAEVGSIGDPKVSHYSRQYLQNELAVLVSIRPDVSTSNLASLVWTLTPIGASSIFKE